MRLLRTYSTVSGSLLTIALVACSGGRAAKDQVDYGTAGKESSITGCLQRGDAGGSFVLRAENEARPQGNELKDRQSSAPRMYRVVADQNQDLASNVDSRVKLTGYVETVPVHATGDAGGSTKPAATSGANTKPQDERSDLIDMKVFKTTAIEKLSGCR